MAVKYFTTRAVDSRLSPGVSFAIRRVSVSDRARFNQDNAALLMKLRDLEIERQELSADYHEAGKLNKLYPCSCAHPEAEVRGGENDAIAEPGHDPVTGQCQHEGCGCRPFAFDVEKNRRWLVVGSQIEQIKQDDLDPLLVRAWCASITDLEIDDQPATPDLLLLKGDPALVREIAGEIDTTRRLTADEVKNSLPLITSGAAEDGRTTTSTAPSVNESGSTKDATAASTSLTS